jgi:hypothetical protein
MYGTNMFVQIILAFVIAVAFITFILYAFMHIFLVVAKLTLIAMIFMRLLNYDVPKVLCFKLCDHNVLTLEWSRCMVIENMKSKSCLCKRFSTCWTDCQVFGITSASLSFQAPTQDLPSNQLDEVPPMESQAPSGGRIS